MALSFQTDVPQFDVTSISPAADMKSIAESKEYELSAERAAVESVIKTAAMAGGTSAIYQSILSDTMLAELESAGYKVELFPDKDTIEAMTKAGYKFDKDIQPMNQHIIKWA